MAIAQGRCPHVTKLNASAAAAVHENVAVQGMELRGGDHLGKRHNETEIKERGISLHQRTSQLKQAGARHTSHSH